MEFSCEGQNGGNNGGMMRMCNHGLDHRELRGQFLVLTHSVSTNHTQGCLFGLSLMWKEVKKHDRGYMEMGPMNQEFKQMTQVMQKAHNWHVFL